MMPSIPNPTSFMTSYDVFGVFGMFASLIMLVLFFVMLAIVLYYFSGEKKRADEFMPHLMTVSLRIFGYVWMFVFSLIAFITLNAAFEIIFRSLGGKRLQSETLLSSIGILLLSVGLIYAMRRLVNTAQKMSNNYGSVSTKLFLFGALATYSVFFVFSIYQFVMIFFDALTSSSSVLLGENVALLLSSMIFAGVLLFKIWKVLVKESR